MKTRLSGNRLRRWGLASAAIALCAAGALLPASANAGQAVSNGRVMESDTAVHAYWTPERMRSAKPMGLYKAGKAHADGAVGTAESGTPVSGAPWRPRAEPSKALARNLFDSRTALGPDVVPFQRDTHFDAFFTTSRIFPDAAVTTWPNRLAGKLYFTIQKSGGTEAPGNYVCSASILRPRLVVTAGHCVSSPSTNPSNRFFYSHWQFVPAFNAVASPQAPFGTWTPSQVWTISTWYFSNGSVPNAQDVGILVMNDQKPPGRTTTLRIGAFLGYFGFLTFGMHNGNNVSAIGYPCNLDSCGRQEITWSDLDLDDLGNNGDNNTWTIGSVMRGGASGGPWIEDYGIRPSGAPATILGGNLIIGVTSYGPIATDYFYLGASQFNNDFITLKNAACGSAGSGNC